MVQTWRPCADCDESVAPHGEDILFQADQVDDDGGEDESREEHDGLEAAVPEEGARHAEHEVQPAYRRWNGDSKNETGSKILTIHSWLSNWTNFGKKYTKFDSYFMQIFTLLRSTGFLPVPRIWSVNPSDFY